MFPLRRRTASILALGLTVASTGLACDKDGSDSAEPGGMIGYEDASSADMAAIPPALEDGDLEGVQERGITLWKMQRAMRLGDRAFSSFVGVTAAKFVALTSIDPGGESGQVAYYQWDETSLDDGDAKAEEARNWVVVPLTLDPDEALDPTELDGKPGGEERRAIAALLLAQGAADAEYPDARWVGYTFREQVMQDGAPTGLRQTRVYMIGADAKSPDIEYTVHDPSNKRQPPKIVADELQLAGDATSSLPLRTPAQSVGPSTVARAVAIATVTDKPVKIVDAAGNKWSVAPKTGKLSKG